MAEFLRSFVGKSIISPMLTLYSPPIPLSIVTFDRTILDEQGRDLRGSRRICS
jgi:hypothetical protein